MTRINPRHFLDEASFVDACVDAATKAIPEPTKFDSYDQALAIRSRRAVVAEHTRDIARDRWQCFVECCAEDFDRGVGAAWE